MTFSGTAPQAYRGQRLGLPAEGPGSLTTSGPRVGALIVDVIASALVAGLFVQAFRSPGGDLASHLPQSWSLIPLAVDYLGGVLLIGGTLGMYFTGLRLVHVDGAGQTHRVGAVRIVCRTVLLMLLIPALVWDKDGRGLHDRLTATAVVRA